MDTPQYAQNTNFVLIFGSVKMKSRRLKSWRNRYLILCVGSSLGPACIIKYSNRQHFEENHAKDVFKIIHIKQCIKKKGTACLILKMIDKTTKAIMFQSDTEAESWLNSIIDLIRTEESKLSTGCCSFYVNMMENINFNFNGDCEFIVDRTSITLKSRNGVLITSWPFQVIRQYRPTQNFEFNVEVGRAAKTGEGVFCFRSYQIQNILTTLDEAIKFQDTPRQEAQNQAPSGGYLKAQNQAPSGGYLSTIHIPVDPM